MANELFLPSIVLCLILAYITGVLTVVGAALLNRPSSAPYVIVIASKDPAPKQPEPEPTANPSPARSRVIHEQSQATFSGDPLNG